MKNKPNISVILPVAAFAVLLGMGIYEYVRIHTLTSELSSLSTKLALVDTRLASTTKELGMLSTDTSENFKKQSTSLVFIEEKIGTYREQVGSVSSTVSNLQKLSQTDPQLLAKYSKVFFLNENYAPTRVTAIPDAYKYSSTKAVSIHADVWPHLQALIDAAKQSGIQIFVSSGYRSFAEQKNLKGEYRVTYGAGTANQFSADQGYSEHQLGTALDFTTTGLGGAIDGIDGTPAYPWLIANAYRYGFILSYPKNNDFYTFEPWHWRYVGVKLATMLHDQAKNFYDLDQRKIDEYLVSIFD